MSDFETRKLYIDLNDGISRVMNNKALYRKLLDMFLSSEEFAKLDAALKAGDNAAAGDVAHAVKGMAGNLGLPKLTEVSTALMHQCRGGTPDPNTVEEYYAAIDLTLQYVKEVAAEIDAGTL